MGTIVRVTYIRYKIYESDTVAYPVRSAMWLCVLLDRDRVFFSGVIACVVFFFQQKTAYEIPKRDWSSDVCSSDLSVEQREADARVLGMEV